MNDQEAAMFRMSKTVPTQDGWYWYADGQHDELRIVEVYSIGGRFMVLDRLSEDLVTIDDFSGYWSQRILPAVWEP